MTALEIIGMILLLFLLLSLLRVGAIVDFGGELRVRLRVGPVKLTVLPRKEKKAQKKAAEAAGKTPEEKTKPKAAGGHRLPKLSFPELRELAGTVLGALKRTRCRTCRRTRFTCRCRSKRNSGYFTDARHYPQGQCCRGTGCQGRRRFIYP